MRKLGVFTILVFLFAGVLPGATQEGLYVGVLDGHEADKIMTSASYSPDGRTIVTTSADKTAIVWDAATGEKLLQFADHEDRVTDAGYGPDGQTIVTGSWDETARIWDVATGKELLRLVGHEGSVIGVGYSPDGKTIVTTGSDGVVIVWDAATGEKLLQPAGHEGRVHQASYSPDGQMIATAGFDGNMRLVSAVDEISLWRNTVRIWDAESGEALLQIGQHKVGEEPLLINEHQPRTVSFSPDGQTVVTGSRSHRARVWDVETGEELFQLIGHMAPVTDACYSPDGQTIATGGADGTVRLWDAKTGGRLLQFSEHMGGAINTISYSPDGRAIVAASQDGTARVWDVAAELAAAPTEDTFWDVPEPDVDMSDPAAMALFWIDRVFNTGDVEELIPLYCDEAVEAGHWPEGGVALPESGYDSVDFDEVEANVNISEQMAEVTFTGDFKVSYSYITVSGGKFMFNSSTITSSVAKFIDFPLILHAYGDGEWRFCPTAE
ncbi:MAG: WD40 repeat domain-containing protein [Anaerolineae bacterium]|nr:WD40 repeat domain-containing protein [Anaerolineae bacterium]